MRKRSIEEQEYQLLALKLRSEKMCYGFFLEIFAGIVITYLLLMWHWIPAALYGSWAIISSYKILKQWRLRAFEYRNFQAEYDAMMFRGRVSTFINKIETSVVEGEKELARMEAEMKDD